MPVQFSWDTPKKRLACYYFVGDWTWEETYKAFHHSWEEIEKLPYVIDSISDFSRSNTVPSGVMTHLRSLAQNRPENTRLMVFVGANPYLTLIVRNFNQLYHIVLKRELKLQFVNTRDEARLVVARLQIEQQVQR
jgi:hypothetical protein